MRVRRIVLEFAAYNKRIPKLFGMHPTRKESTIGSSHQIYKFKFKFKFKFKLKLANLQVAQAPHYIPHGSRRGNSKQLIYTTHPAPAHADLAQLEGASPRRFHVRTSALFVGARRRQIFFSSATDGRTDSCLDFCRVINCVRSDY